MTKKQPLLPAKSHKNNPLEDFFHPFGVPTPNRARIKRPKLKPAT
jgi:hypothetical protein